MELWIRTQKRDNLIKVDWLKMEEIPNGYDKEYYIYYKNERLLGIYKTKERALEVLDEIQKILKPKIKLKYNDDFTMNVSSIELQPATYVYEMPEE